MDRLGTHELTQLLAAWSDGEEEALEKLAPLVHAELYRLAKRYMSRERPDHLLQTSALINEAYVRLIDWKAVRWQNRAHFFGVAAQIMRRILVDFARRRPRVDKDVEAIRMSLDAVPDAIDPQEVRTFLVDLPGVSDVHDLHIWPISTTNTALTCHLVMTGGHPGDQFLSKLTHDLEHRFSIDHATVQIEHEKLQICLTTADDCSARV